MLETNDCSGVRMDEEIGDKTDEKTIKLVNGLIL